MQVVRVYLSSPGDVADERGLARRVIEMLPRDDPWLRGRVVVEPVAWDDGVPVAMFADRTPQASVNQRLPLPSQCDVVIVLLWGRMGTPLPRDVIGPDGMTYASGTEWEFHDALRAHRDAGAPVILVYRRTAPVVCDLRDPDIAEVQRQLRLVDDFLDRMVDPATGAALHGVNSYEAPEDLRRMLEVHLREVMHGLVSSVTSDPQRHESSQDTWSGSPFPGLRSFTDIDEPIFFGRGRDTDRLVKQVVGHQFTAIVGASGSGKSSLVAAGLLPRLATSDGQAWSMPRYEPQVGKWVGLWMTPGEVGGDPHIALAQRLAELLNARTKPVLDQLSPAAVGGLVEEVRGVLRGRRQERALLVVDQLEELFTLAPEAVQGPFADLLAHLADSDVFRVVVTVRADFYERCLTVPSFASLLKQGHVPLAAPTDELLEIITRPADRAALEFEAGLPGRILHDTGPEPGALPLLAYALDELYRASAGSGQLTHRAYDRLGGVAGAIGSRAREVFEGQLSPGARQSFTTVFTALVDVDHDGHVSRRRAAFERVAPNVHSRELVEKLTDARLLEQSSVGGHAVVYVAHEILFSSWDRLREWIDSARSDLRVINSVRAAAVEWDESRRQESYLWPQERLDRGWQAVDRLRPDLDEAIRAFLLPEHYRLLPALRDPALETYRREAIADRLVELAPATLPGLLDLLHESPADVRAIVAAALGRIGPSAVPGLSLALRDADAEVRMAAVAALRRTGAQFGVPQLLTMVADPDERVRSMALGAVEALGGKVGPDALAASAALGGVDERWQAAGSVGSYGVAGVPRLLDMMTDTSGRVREAARRALQAIGDDTLPSVLAALHDTVGRRGEAAAQALADHGPSVLEHVLREASDPVARPHVQAALRLLGTDTVPDLLQVASRVTGPQRSVVEGALVDIGTVAALLGVVELGLTSIDALLTER